jgi:hypothetical protein
MGMRQAIGDIDIDIDIAKMLSTYENTGRMLIPVQQDSNSF